MRDKEIRRPSLLMAVCTFLGIFTIIVLSVVICEATLQSIFLVVIFFVILVSMGVRFSWPELKQAMIQGASVAMVVIFFMILVGALIACGLQVA